MQMVDVDLDVECKVHIHAHVHVDVHVLYMFATVPISRTNAYTQRVVWFIFSLRKKTGLIICTTNYICYILRLSFLISNRKTYTYLSDQTWATKPSQQCSEWVHFCLYLKSDRFTFADHVTWGFWELPTLMTSLGCLPFGLPRSCCR